MPTTGVWRRAATAGALVVALLAGCGTGELSAVKLPTGEVARGPTATDSSYDPTSEDEQQLRELMSARADAVRDRDEKAFLATVDPGQRKLRASQRVLFRNLVQLPLASLRYETDTTYVVPADVPGTDPVLHPGVVEELQITGTLTRPLSNRLDLTFVKRGDRWLVGAERALRSRRSMDVPQERPWFGGPIAVGHEGQLTVLVDRSAEDQLPGLTTAVREGIQRNADILGVDPDEQVLIDATNNGQASSFGGGSKVEVGAVAFQLASTGADGTATDIAGVAIKLNPERAAAALGEEQLLWHELTHYLLVRFMASSPVWLSEGVAAWVEYQPTELSGLVVPDRLHERVNGLDHSAGPRALLQRPRGQLPDCPGRRAVAGRARWHQEAARADADLRPDLRGRQHRRAHAEGTAQGLRHQRPRLTDGAWVNLAELHH